MTTANTTSGFNGEYLEPLTGHYLLGNGYRAYNPVLMRFNSPDRLSPFGEGGINAYGYCKGDPVNHIDPTGHYPKLRPYVMQRPLRYSEHMLLKDISLISKSETSLQNMALDAIPLPVKKTYINNKQVPQGLIPLFESATPATGPELAEKMIRRQLSYASAPQILKRYVSPKRSKLELPGIHASDVKTSKTLRSLKEDYMTRRKYEFTRTSMEIEGLINAARLRRENFSAAVRRPFGAGLRNPHAMGNR